MALNRRDWIYSLMTIIFGWAARGATKRPMLRIHPLARSRANKGNTRHG